jgi:hypothetical protein
MVDNPCGIPQAMRDRAEENMKQAHAAYEELTDYVNKAMNAGTGGIPSNSMGGARFKDVRDRAMDFAKANAESAFTFASKVCSTQTPQELFALEKQFAQDRFQAFVMHTQDLYGLIGETSQETVTL